MLCAILSLIGPQAHGGAFQRWGGVGVGVGAGMASIRCWGLCCTRPLCTGLGRLATGWVPVTMQERTCSLFPSSFRGFRGWAQGGT